MPWPDESPVQNVPSTPLLCGVKRDVDTPVALVPENIGYFDSPDIEDRVPGTPSTQNLSSCLSSCKNFTSTPDLCKACFRTRTPKLSSRRRDLSRDLFHSTPNMKQRLAEKDMFSTVKEQVVPGTPCTPSTMQDKSSKPYRNTQTPSKQQSICKRPQRLLTPPPLESKLKATINLFKGDDIFG